MEGNNFEFSCPNYVDFEKECFSEDDTISDVFFDCSAAQLRINKSGNEDNSGPNRMRRSISVGNLVMFDEETKKDTYHKPDLQNIQEKTEDKCSKTQSMCINSDDESNKLHKGKLFDSKSANEQLKKMSAGPIKRGASHGNLSKLAQHKPHSSVDDLKSQPSKFVSMAEAINKFQTATPIRFRSKPSIVQPNDKCLTRTVPQSPALQTKARSRPITNILTHEEKELRQFEELQKCKIKAHPVNKKILQGPVKPVHPPEKKPSTIVRPFNLTETHPKKVEPSPEKFRFHAQPIYTGEEHSRKTQAAAPRRPLTQAVTPSFMKNYKRTQTRVTDEPKNCEQDKPSWKNERTKPIPFSFELRDKMVQEKRKRLIQKQMEEERKAREFVARGVPKYIQNKNRSSAKSESGSSACSSRRNVFHSQENLSTQFKARPPTVLFKEPFVPAKSEAPLTEVKPFNLESEMRAIERLEFQRKLEIKEEQTEYLKRIREEEIQRQEEEERRRIRRECEQIKAQPVRKFKPIHIQPSGKVTEPISPNFCYKKLQHRENKENVVNN
ncbi:targeting protein for Xklp2-like [Anthonomus grandis grandis]|uniref:targeting protein for Xklp2-like n=1 Tax=Anthonomus grandis grandis TaxID=2921223 RepID=UPI0021667854|nr:targeting protein for Xklp2-like [Anthonomus grandis grandis]